MKSKYTRWKAWENKHYVGYWSERWIWLFKVWDYNAGFSVSDQLSFITSDARRLKEEDKSGQAMLVLPTPSSINLLASILLLLWGFLNMISTNLVSLSRLLCHKFIHSFSMCTFFTFTLPEAKKVPSWILCHMEQHHFFILHFPPSTLLPTAFLPPSRIRE